MLTSTTPSSGRLPGLDGLRAISIIFVVIGHAYQGATGHSPKGPFWGTLGNAGLGVEVFFVISGFIITHLLLREYEKTATISLRIFYSKRSFRILPPLYLYILFAMIFQFLGIIDKADFHSYILSLLFISNYFANDIHLTLRHTWSLSIEEQFYLFWPVTLLLLLRGSRSRTYVAVAVLIVLSPLLRVVNASYGGDLSRLTYFLTYTRLDSLMFGCLGALLYDQKTVHNWISRGRRIIPAAFAGIVMLDPWLTARYGGAYEYLISYTLNGAVVMSLILLVSRSTGSLLDRCLNYGPIAYVGTISYGLYLWQQIFLRTRLHDHLGTILAIALTTGVAALSFRYFETPLLALRRRWVR